jgi:Arabinose-binding domain of AraC transcription regulator, N-term
MGNLIRATNLWGYGDLVRELGADPQPFLSRFHIPPGVENEEDAFVPYEAAARMLEASAADLGCPDFGLRLSRWQGLDILGPIAVIARNAQTLLDGLEAIARFLYVHSPALKLAVAPRTAETDFQFSYEMTEPALPYPPQSYFWADRRLAPARFRSCTINWLRMPRTTKRWVARCAFLRRPADSRYPDVWPTGPLTALIQKPDASPRNTLSPITYRAPRRCPNGWRSWPAACCPPANAARRSSPTNSPCTHGRCNDTWPPRPCDARTSSNGNAATKRRGTLPNRGCISAKSRACLAIPNRAHSTGRAGVGSGRHLGSTGPAYRCRGRRPSDDAARARTFTPTPGERHRSRKTAARSAIVRVQQSMNWRCKASGPRIVTVDGQPSIRLRHTGTWSRIFLRNCIRRDLRSADPWRCCGHDCSWSKRS